MDDYEKMMAILQANAHKSFVQRILFPQNYPILDRGNGVYSTHSMASGESNGRYYAFPTVLMNQNGALQDYGKDAFGHALATGNHIEFPTPEEAEYFATHYKAAWGGMPNNEPQ